jgi:hypothetical protein
MEREGRDARQRGGERFKTQGIEFDVDSFKLNMGATCGR